MRLGRISVKNHSRIADLDIIVRGHLVLVGANDVGKTSILRAVNLALGSAAQLYQSLSTNDIRDQEKPFIVDVSLINLTDDELSHFHREVTVAADDGAKSLEVRLEVSVDPEDGESIQISRWCPGRGEVRALTREQLAAIGWRYLPAVRQASAAQLDSRDGAIQTLLRAVEPELGAERIALGDLLGKFNTTLGTSTALEGLRDGMARHLSNSMPRSISKENLAVRTITDPAESVLENLSIYITRDGDFSPLSEQSDGIRQLISMTLFDLAEGAANVIAIDEPEIHLHPSSQRTVAELLSSERNQKILVTHSPYIVQKFDPIQVVAVSPNGECHQIDPDKVAVAERTQALWWSPRMLEALTARFAIVVEGVADRLVVEAAARVLGISLDRIGATVFELDGADKFRALYKLLGPNGFAVEILGLVDDAEKGSWLSAIGGKPAEVLGKHVFVSKADLEDEYCRAIDPEALAQRLVAAKVAQKEQALLSACGVDAIADLAPEEIAKFCRGDGGKNIGNRKVPSALAIAKGLTAAEVAKMESVHSLLTELRLRSEK